jgi:hypothetical protein
LQRARELGLGVSEVVVAYVLYNGVYAALGYPAGKARRSGQAAPRVRGGVAVFGVVHLGLGVATSGVAVWVLLPMYGAFAALTDGVSGAWIAGLVAPAQRSWALGVHGASTAQRSWWPGCGRVWPGVATTGSHSSCRASPPVVWRCGCCSPPAGRTERTRLGDDARRSRAAPRRRRPDARRRHRC